MMSWLRSLFSRARRTTGGPSCRLRVEQLEGRVVPAGVIAVGSGAGVTGRVALFHDSNNDGVPDGFSYATFNVFGDFTGGVRVAVGDFVGDSNLELAAATGPGAGRLLIFHLDANGAPTGTPEQIEPFGSSFTHGLNIARARTGGAAHASLVVAADAGGEPQVAVYSDDTATGGATPGDGLLANSRVDSFLAFGPAFRGGVRLAAGRNLTAGDVSDTVALATGPGVVAHVRIVKDANNDFRLSDNLSAAETLFPVGDSWTGGLFVALGDVGSPSANAELVVGRGAGSAPRVFIFTDANNNGLYGDDHGPASTFLAFDPSLRVGVHPVATRLSPAAVNLQGELMVAPGPGAPLQVRVYKAASNGEIGPTTTPLAKFFPLEFGFTAGYSVAFGGNGS